MGPRPTGTFPRVPSTIMTSALFELAPRSRRTHIQVSTARAGNFAPSSAFVSDLLQGAFHGQDPLKTRTEDADARHASPGAGLPPQGWWQETEVLKTLGGCCFSDIRGSASFPDGTPG